MFGILPCFGFICRYVNGFTFRDVDLSFKEPDQRPALICDDVHNLQLNEFEEQVAKDVSVQAIFRDSHEVIILGCRPSASDVFLRLENKCSQINIVASDLSLVKIPFQFDESTPKSAVRAEYNYSR